MRQRPDTPAILGLIVVAALLVIGWVILTVAGKDTPPEAWIALSTLVGVVGGWVGKTMTAEPPAEPVEPPAPVESPAPVMAVPEQQTWAAPVATQDRAERTRISQYLAEASADVPQPE